MNRLPRLLRCLALVAGLAAWSVTAQAACSSPAAEAGAIKYASNASTFVFCNGTNWVSMAGWNNTNGGGASLLNELNDVDTSGAGAGSILAYNGSQWVVSSSSYTETDPKVGTLTNTKWCTTDGSVINCATDAPLTSASFLTDLADVNTTGVGEGKILAYDADTTSWVISDSAPASTALGDRITSGTVSVTVNTDGYISLTTGVTDWGYLSSGNSYLPTLVAGRVSATNISATHLQLSSPSTVLACNSGFTGAMRYTSGTMQVCDGSNWGNIGIGVPTGTIAAFAASSCPNGWSEYTASRGRFLRGMDMGAGNDPDWPRAAGSAQDDALQDLTGSFTARGTNGATPPYAVTNGSGVFSASDGGSAANISLAGGNSNVRSIAFDASNVARTANETRPKNVAVTFCVYSGFQSAPGQTILTTLASLTDVSLNGVTNGQVLAYNGTNWVASNTTNGSVTGSGAANHLAYWSGANTLAHDANQLSWDATNNRLGIGTGTPGAALSVAGNVSVTGALYVGTANVPPLNDYWSGATARWLVSDYGVIGTNGSYESTWTWNGYRNNSASWTGLGINGYQSAAMFAMGPHGIRFSTSDITPTATMPNVRMLITHTGDVGIGTNSPRAKLDVAGTISASDAIQVGSSSLTCGAGIAGAMRYTSGTMQVCDGSNWGNIGIGVPTGTIAAFESASCPSGWNEYNASRGRFLRGRDNGSGNDPDGTRAPGNAQDDAAPNITGRVGPYLRYSIDTQTGALANVNHGTRDYGGTTTRNFGYIDFDASASNAKYGAANEIRPKNVAVTYCVYAGYQSAPGQTVLTTLASLTDVSVNGALNGQVLAFNGANWVPSNTTGGVGGSGAANHLAYWSNASTLAHDANQLSWNATNNRLGIGTGTPQATLQVSGSFIVSSTQTNANPALYVGTDGNVGLGTTQPAATLEVSSTEGIRMTKTGGTANAPFLSWHKDGTRQGYFGYGVPGSYLTLAMENGNDLYIAGNNVGIGRSAPIAKLDVVGSISASTSVDVGTQVFGNSGDSITAPTYTWTGDTNTGMYAAAADSIGFTAGGAQRARITTAGVIVTGYLSTTSVVDIGTQARGNAGDSSGTPTYSWSGDTNTGLFTPGADTVGISTGGSERMRVTSGGDVAIGNTNPYYRLHVTDNLPGYMVYIQNLDTTTSADAVVIRTGPTSNPGSSNGYLSFQDGDGTVIGNVTGDGSGGTNYNQTSDRRIKDNITDTHYTLDDLMKVQVRDYSPKSNPHTRKTGYIAQELYEVFPDAVTVPEDEDEYWTVGYGRITPLIVKAVQDLKRENDRLRTEVTTVTETLRAELKAANDNFRSLKAEIDGLRRTLGR